MIKQAGRPNSSAGRLGGGKKLDFPSNNVASSLSFQGFPQCIIGQPAYNPLWTTRLAYELEKCTNLFK